MSIEGIWSSEIMGLFGWEPVGVVMFSDGNVMGGGASHHSSGTYKFDDDRVTIDVKVEFHGTPRTLFGAADPSFTVQGTLKLKGNVLEGTVRREDTPDQTVTYRLTRRADLP